MVGKVCLSGSVGGVRSDGYGDGEVLEQEEGTGPKLRGGWAPHLPLSTLLPAIRTATTGYNGSGV